MCSCCVVFKGKMMLWESVLRWKSWYLKCQRFTRCQMGNAHAFTCGSALHMNARLFKSLHRTSHI